MLDNFIIYTGSRYGGAQLREWLKPPVSRLVPFLKGLHVSLGKDEREVTPRGAVGLIISDQLQIEL
ncbi:hypothetical protein [Salipiger pallidus]|nr:hypothetical protein [Salipiger pallidus]